MNKELKYFRKIAKIAVKYSEKKKDYDFNELNQDIKELAEFSHYLEGVIYNAESGRNGLIANALEKMRNIESCIANLPSRQAAVQSSEQPENGWMDKKGICRKYGLKMNTLNSKLKKTDVKSKRDGHRKLYLVDDSIGEQLKSPQKISESLGKDWMTVKQISGKYKIGGATFYNKIRQIEVETRKIGKKKFYHVTEDVEDRLKVDLEGYVTKNEMLKKCRLSPATFYKRAERHNISLETKKAGNTLWIKMLNPEQISLLQQRLKEKAVDNPSGYVSQQELLQKCGLSYTALRSRLKSYSIPYETKKIGKRLFFKEFGPVEIKLLKHKKLKDEKIGEIRQSIESGREIKRIPKFKNHIDLDSLNKKLGTTDGKILEMMDELDIKPAFRGHNERKITYFRNKDIRKFREFLEAKKGEENKRD